MNALPRTPGTVAAIERAVAELGTGALKESAIQTHVAPLFSRVLRRNKTGTPPPTALAGPRTRDREIMAEASGVAVKLGDA
jgi:hypothetical protein